MIASDENAENAERTDVTENHASADPGVRMSTFDSDSTTNLDVIGASLQSEQYISAKILRPKGSFSANWSFRQANIGFPSGGGKIQIDANFKSIDILIALHPRIKMPSYDNLSSPVIFNPDTDNILIPNHPGFRTFSSSSSSTLENEEFSGMTESSLTDIEESVLDGEKMDLEAREDDQLIEMMLHSSPNIARLRGYLPPDTISSRSSPMSPFDHIELDANLDADLDADLNADLEADSDRESRIRRTPTFSTPRPPLRDLNAIRRTALDSEKNRLIQSLLASSATDIARLTGLRSVDEPLVDLELVSVDLHLDDMKVHFSQSNWAWLLNLVR